MLTGQGSLSIKALHACVYIYIRQLSSFRAPTLWFIDLNVTTCHIQYSFFWVYHFFFHEKTDKAWKFSKSTIFIWYANGCRRFLGVQSINTERAALIVFSQFCLCVCVCGVWVRVCLCMYVCVLCVYVYTCVCVCVCVYVCVYVCVVYVYLCVCLCVCDWATCIFSHIYCITAVLKKQQHWV